MDEKLRQHQQRHEMSVSKAQLKKGRLVGVNPTYSENPLSTPRSIVAFEDISPSCLGSVGIAEINVVLRSAQATDLEDEV